MKRLLTVLAAATLLAACGSSDAPATPAACLDGPGELLSALKSAPDPVLLGGTTPISDCLVDRQGAGELATIGQSAITAATRLNSIARKDPSGAASTELGYLVGALEEGASGADGTYADLVRRLNAAARFNDGAAPLPAAFERAYGAGYAAAREDG